MENQLSILSKENNSRQEKDRAILFVKERLTARKEDLEVRVLQTIQKIGLDVYSSKKLYDVLLNSIKTTESFETASLALSIVSDIVYYYSLFKTEDIKWLIKEDGRFNEVRKYKLEKCNYICGVWAIRENINDLKNEIELWAKKIILYKDEEYVDLLAFSIANNEIHPSRSLLGIFEHYIDENSQSDAAAEMAITLARCGYENITDRIKIMLEDKNYGKPWIEAALASKNLTLLYILRNDFIISPNLQPEYEQELENLITQVERSKRTNR